VVKGTVWSASLTNGEMATTVEGKTITINIGSGIILFLEYVYIFFHTGKYKKLFNITLVKEVCIVM
jgi:hypothetical protein